MKTLHLICKDNTHLYENERGFFTGWWHLSHGAGSLDCQRIALHREPHQAPFLVGRIERSVFHGLTTGFACHKLPPEMVTEAPTQWLRWFAITR